MFICLPNPKRDHYNPGTSSRLECPASWVWTTQTMVRLIQLYTTLLYAYRSDKIDGQFPETCPLCFDDMTCDSIFRRLPCKHLMHKNCIDKWLCTKDGSCPFCRQTFYHLRKPTLVQTSGTGTTATVYVDDEDDKDQLEMGRAAFMLWFKGLFRRV